MKLTLNRFFLSKKSARTTVAIGYISSILTFLGGMLVYYEYRKYGYFVSRSTLIPGKDAFFTAVALIAVSIAFFLFAIYLTIMYLFFSNRGDFERVSTGPDILICDTCQTKVPANQALRFVCPKCGGKLGGAKESGL